MQTLAPIRPDEQCQYWSCNRTVRPFCSQDHETLSQEGEQSPAAVVVVDGLNETYAKWASLKCVHGKRLDPDTHYGFPLLPLAVFTTPPWLQPGVFDFNLRPNEAVREWVFTAAPIPSSNLYPCWIHYETRDQFNVRVTKFHWNRGGPVKLTGFFRLTLYSVPMNSDPAPQLAVFKYTNNKRDITKPYILCRLSASSLSGIKLEGNASRKSESCNLSEDPRMCHAEMYANPSPL